MPETNSALTTKKIEWAYKKWCEGYTEKQIAKALFVSTRTIQRAFKDLKRERPELKYDEITLPKGDKQYDITDNI